MKIKRDQIAGLVLILLGIVVGILVSQFKTPFAPEYPGPKLMPGIAVFGFIVCGAGIFFSSMKDKKAQTIYLSKEGWTRVVLCFALLCAYIFAMKYLGFLIVTPFVLYALITYFAKGSSDKIKIWHRVIAAVAITAVVYLAYVVMFSMTLPSGLLFE